MNNRIEGPAVVFRPAAWIAACLVAGTVAVGDASAEVPSREPGGQEDVLSRYSGEPLSVNFQDVEVRSVLQLIADFAGLNLVVGSEVTGRMTLHLVDVAWDEALEVVLTTNGLGKRLTGSVLRVAPADEFAAQERLQLERLRAEAELAPLETKLIRVRHADAGVLASLLDANGDSAELERGRVIVDPRTNSLVLTDTADNLVAAEQLIDQLDIPVRQVQIEARIVNANSNFSEQLGIRVGGGGFTTGKPPHVKFGGSLRTLSDIQNMLAGEGDGGIRHPDDLLVDLGVEGGGSIGIGVTDAGYLLDMELSALAAEGHAEIVARPKVITTDKHSAVIESGVEIPFQQATKSGATSIAFKDAVLQLEVTPQITPDDRIVIDLTVKQDTVGRIYQGVPSVNTTRISTQVLVDDGDTVVLGGIFQTDRHQTTERTPLLGDLPVLGRLFRRTLERDDKQELFVFITPSILRDAKHDPARVAPAGEAR